MFIFWDNSNIHFSGVNYACPKIEPDVDPVLYRTYFRNLFELVRNNRSIDKAYVAGSVPPPSDSLWEHLRNLDIQLTLLDKTASGKEQDSVDISLQSMMLRSILDYPPNTMAILTGDGAGALEGKGFLSDLQRAHRIGWSVEVYSWEGTCNRYLRDFAEKNGKFVSLEKYYYSISFIRNGRIVRPL